MKQYENLKKIRKAIQRNGGLTIGQISTLTGIDSTSVTLALNVMGDAYLDRWTGRPGHGTKQLIAVYDLIEKPEPCPRPH